MRLQCIGTDSAGCMCVLDLSRRRRWRRTVVQRRQKKYRGPERLYARSFTYNGAQRSISGSS